jgi:peroxiredoxin
LAMLVGTPFPDLTLPSTSGARAHILYNRTVIFFYPYTGRPGHSDPEGWDTIPGAHGSTPQALGFSKLLPEFEKLGIQVCGVSFQTTEWQQEFVDRHKLPFPLLSDAARKLSTTLSLQTFRAGGNDYLVRRTIIVEKDLITHEMCPIETPKLNAEHTLKLLQP